MTLALRNVVRTLSTVAFHPRALVNLALRRERARVLEGGHDVPEIVVRRRFNRSIRNFMVRYRDLGDSWILFDNSGTSPTVIAFEKQASLRIINQELYEMVVTRYGKS